MSDIKLEKFCSTNRSMGERPPDYPNGWIPVLESQDLKPNQTKPVSAFGYELVVFRGPSGAVHVIDAFCPHLGAHLGIAAKVGKGRCGNDCITCPFHGWQFRASDGQCTLIPNLNDNEINTINAKLTVWRCIERNDVIYVWHHYDGADPHWEPDIISQIEDKQWQCVARTEYSIDCHIQEIEENWTDMAHFPAVHVPLFYPYDQLSWWQDLLQRSISFNIRTNWTTVNEPEPYNAMASIDALTTVFGYDTWAMNFQFKQVGPATLVISYESPLAGGVSGALIQYVNPVAPNKLRFILRNYCSQGFRSRIFAKVLNYFELFMIERDMIIWNNKRFIKTARYTKLDRPIVKFRRWYSQFYADKNYNVLDW
ncbi:cholesterol 7-desaturase nvd-like [Oppia nitens]|uniref:cholesterol 7-desaturase nvd-like n=1 Tax=Oppia nitens TaxID=1686743 RepID=UPI0023DC596D|nr:cholesterol 7-desaturase nvd-like [Oppia nitens]